MSIDWISQTLGSVGGLIGPFLLALTAVVFVHELGHFLLARRNGVKVEVFSIGFGPELLGWTDRKDTRWRVSLIPLGGYVKMLGEQDESGRPETAPGTTPEAAPSKSQKAATAQTTQPADHATHSFVNKSILQKIAILVAGPAFNYIFAIVVIFLTYATLGQQYLSSEVSSVVEGGAAERAGLLAGDRIIAIDAHTIQSFQDIQKTLASLPARPETLTVKILREGQEHVLTVHPDIKELDDRLGRKQRIVTLGVVKGTQFEYLPHTVVSALGAAVSETYQISRAMLQGIGQMITGTRSSDELRGVLSIAKISGDVAQLGISAFLHWLALLSINLGLINLFPIPPLDGGHILFYTIHGVLGRPLAERIQDYVFRLGFVLIVLVMVLSFWNDLKHIGLVEWVRHLLPL